MEHDPPLTAKQAALQGAQGDRPLFDPQVDKRHVLRGALRLAQLDTGRIEVSDDDSSTEEAAADESADSPVFPEPSESPFHAVSDGIAGIEPSASGDFSLADVIRADHDASHVFSMGPEMVDAESIPWRSSISADYSADGMAGELPSTIYDVGPEKTAYTSLTSTGIPTVSSFATAQGADHLTPTPSWYFDAVSSNDAQQAYGTPPDVHNFLDGYDTTDFDGEAAGPTSSADTASLPRVEQPSDRAPRLEKSSPAQSAAPVTFFTAGTFEFQQDAENQAPGKRKFEFESSLADAQRDGVLALLALESGFLKLIDQAGEQDRHDAFARAASRRACL